MAFLESKDMSKLPLVSIMIPTYNQAAYLRAALSGALAQDYPNLEVLVADDHSADETESLVKQTPDPRLRYFRNDPNLGRVANYRKTLYDHAKGSWVLNLDGDDCLIDRGFISAAVAAAVAEKHTVMVCGDRYEWDDPFEVPAFSDEARKTPPEYLDGTAYVLSLPRPPWRIHHLATLYDRTMAMTIDFYRKDIVSSDYESLWRLVLGQRIAHIPAKVAIWRRHGQNASRSGHTENSIANYALFDSVRDYAQRRLSADLGDKFSLWHRRNVAKRFYTSLLSHMEDHDFSGLRQLAAFVRSAYPLSYGDVLRSPKTWLQAIGALAGLRL